MINAEQFARVKALFDQLSDLPTHEREPLLTQLEDLEDPAVIVELRNLLDNTAVDEDRYARPIEDALTQLMPDQPGSGDILGAWTLIEEIGVGGMGKVFLAKRSDGHFEQTAAIKLHYGVPSSQALELLARERQILASLSHPGISRLLDGGSTPAGQPYFVMEYVDGQPIHHYCQHHQLDTRARLRLLIEVCDALSFAHQQLVVHCDLKPSNILVNNDRRPMLLDFGISRHLPSIAMGPADSAESVDPKITSTIKGYTPRYASPEQIDGQRVGTPTDVYSLGLIMAELLDARADDSGTLDVAKLPRDLAAIVSRATEPEPSNRYSGVDALADDLRRYLGRFPVQARPQSLAYRAQRWLYRQWPWVTAGLIFLVTIGGFTARMRDERDNALASERAARAVTDFMITVFQGADPEISGQKDLPVSELLDKGRDRLAASLIDQPMVHAEMAGILGSVYQTIGKRDQAQGMFDEALEIIGASEQVSIRAALLHKKAYTTYDQEDFSAAEPLAREALALREQHQPGSLELVDTRRLLGSILSYLGERDEARGLLNQALTLSKQISGPDSAPTGRVHLDLGRHHLSYDLEGTDTLHHGNNARRIFERLRGNEHFLYVDALEVLAYGHMANSGFEQAVELAQEVSEKRVKLYGEVSYQAGFGLYSYAYLLNAAGERLQALPIALRCLQIQEQLDGAGTLSSGAPGALLADIQNNLGLYDEAAETYAQIIDIYSRLQPGNVSSIASNRLKYGRAKRLAGHLDEAALNTPAALTAYLGDENAIPFRVYQAQLENGALLREMGRLDDAVTTLESIDRSSLDGEAWVEGDIDMQYALIDAARGNFDQALVRMRIAETKIAGGLGEESPDAWLMRIERAKLLAQMGETESSQLLAREIAESAKASIAPGGKFARELEQLGAFHR